MTREELQEALKHPNIHVEQQEDVPGMFNRKTSFIIDGRRYTIEWWCNVCYLYYGNVMVRFDSIKQSGTWPNNAKTNLEFYLGSELVAVIPIEQYPEV